MDFTDRIIQANVTDELIEEALEGAAEGWGVFIYNDHNHTMHEVATQLMIALRCSVQQAWRIMMNAHDKGYSLVAVTGKDDAETIAEILKMIHLKVEVVQL